MWYGYCPTRKRRTDNWNARATIKCAGKLQSFFFPTFRSFHEKTNFIHFHFLQVSDEHLVPKPKKWLILTGREPEETHEARNDESIESVLEAENDETMNDDTVESENDDSIASGSDETWSVDGMSDDCMSDGCMSDVCVYDERERQVLTTNRFPFRRGNL